MDKRRKIIILINDLLRGGAQRIVVDVARVINKEEFDFRVVYLKSHSVFPAGSKTLTEELEATGVSITCLEGGSKFRIRDAVRIYGFLKQERPEVLHTFLPYASILGRIIGRLAGVHKILSTQCNLAVSYTRKVYWLDKITLPLAHVWTAVTEGIEESYGHSVAVFTEELYRQGRRHFSISSGVDVKRIDGAVRGVDREKKLQELGLNKESILIVMTARLISWKGQDDLIRALEFLQPNVEIVFIGAGPYFSALEKLARELGVLPRVHFLRTRSDVYEILALGQVFAQTHRFDEKGNIWVGANIAQIEACAAGIPSMCTRVPYIENLIEDGVTGKLAEPNNPKDLARAINYLIANPERASEMAIAAKKRVISSYSIERMVGDYSMLYKLL